MGKRKKKKIPAKALAGEIKKEVKLSEGVPQSYDSYCPSWQFNLLDLSGPFGWKNINADEIWDIFSVKIKDKEHINWNELKSAGSHNVEYSNLTKIAQKRLAEIGQNDIDELFSLRLTGKTRIWGIRDRYQLKILWWDPEHKVCLSQKKHT